MSDSIDLTQGFIAFDPNKELILQASSDPAWLNAIFSLVALYRDLRTGRGISPECLYHRGEALRLVNESLSINTSQAINDWTVGAVASLVNFDITVGSTSNASMHMAGLQHIVMSQGGIRAYRNNHLLQSLISWCDLLYSSGCDSHPRFDFACDSSAISLTTACVTDFRIYNEHLSHPPGFNAKMRETVRILRDLSHKKRTVSLSADKSNMSSLVDRTEYSNCMYLAEYRLLTLFDEVATHHTLTSMRKSWQLGVYLYLHLALRELPGAAQFEYNFVKRLKMTLEAAPNLYEVWTTNLSLLLWIMFIGAVAATHRVERVYFVQHTSILANELGILSRLDFMTLLKSVMWLESFCGPHAVALWGDVEVEIGKIGHHGVRSHGHELGGNGPLLSIMEV